MTNTVQYNFYFEILFLKNKKGAEMKYFFNLFLLFLNFKQHKLHVLVYTIKKKLRSNL